MDNECVFDRLLPGGRPSEDTLPDAPSEPSEGTTPALPDFVRLEKSLASLGFFTPASKTAKKPVAKTVQFTRLVGGRRMAASVSIVPSVLGALPTTADQDKYLAFQKLLLDRRPAEGPIVNPVGFTSAELLRLLGTSTDAGKNYRDVARWLQVMTSTTVVSEGAVFLADRRSWATDTFHVFDRAVSVGRALPDGSVADRNWVWLSEWQLENINGNHLLPVDFEAYRRLGSHVAKALVPLLQVWLYASEAGGVFEKRYDELCQHLRLREYRYPSQIKEKLGPALDELVAQGYLAAWDVREAADGRGHKVVFEHGAKYFQDRAHRSGRVLAALGRPVDTHSTVSPSRSGGPEPSRPAGEEPQAGEGAGTPAGAGKPHRGPLGAVSGHSGEDASGGEAEEVCRHFHEVLYGAGRNARLIPAELQEASDLVARHGAAAARYVVDFFAREVAPRTAFRPATICGLRPHMARALQDLEARRMGKRIAPSVLPGGAALANARHRHTQRWQGAYDGFRRRVLAEIERAQPEAFAAFREQEAAQRERECGGKHADLRAIARRSFDREERRLSRAWQYFAGRKDWGVLTFWEWDETHNPKRFCMTEATGDS